MGVRECHLLAQSLKTSLCQTNESRRGLTIGRSAGAVSRNRTNQQCDQIWRNFATLAK